MEGEQEGRSQREEGRVRWRRKADVRGRGSRKAEVRGRRAE